MGEKMEEGKNKEFENENIEPENELNQEQNIEIQNQEEVEKTEEKVNIEENTKDTALIEIKVKKRKKHFDHIFCIRQKYSNKANGTVCTVRCKLCRFSVCS